MPLEIRINEEIIKLCILEFRMKMVFGVDLWRGTANGTVMNGSRSNRFRVPYSIEIIIKEYRSRISSTLDKRQD